MDTLGGINHQDSSFDSLKRAGNFIGKIDVAGSIDKVKRVALPLHLDWSELNRNPFFTFKLHRVEQLRLHFASRNSASQLHHTISNRRLSMIDVSYDTEIANF